MSTSTSQAIGAPAPIVDAFMQAIAFTLRPDVEGGLVDDPDDPGGITNMGLTIADLTVWERHRATPDDVRNLTRGEAVNIYRAQYWNAIRGFGLPSGLSLMVFDHGVNRGNGTSAKILQRLLGFPDDDVDGWIGPSTQAASRMAMANSPDRGATFLRQLHQAQRADYLLLGRPKYEGGWLSRCDRRFAAGLQAAGLSDADPQAPA